MQWEFPLEEGGPKRLKVTLERKTEVRLDGVVVHTVESFSRLRTGPEFALPDGSLLKLRLMPLGSLVVLRNGRPLPGWDATMNKLVRREGIFMWILSFGWAYFAVRELRSNDISSIDLLPLTCWIVKMFGGSLIFLVLGFLVKPRPVFATWAFSATLSAGIAYNALTGNYSQPRLGWIALAVHLLIVLGSISVARLALIRQRLRREFSVTEPKMPDPGVPQTSNNS